MALTGWKRYGLEDNPYIPRELDPVSRPEEAEYIVPVESFAEIIDLDNYFRQSDNEGRSPIFLIYGPDGSGSSSMANYILARYRDFRQIPVERFVVPAREVPNHDVVKLFTDWAYDLYNEFSIKGIPLGDMDAKLYDLPESINLQSLEGKYKIVLRLLAQTLGQQPAPGARAGFGVCLESMPAADIVKTSLNIFQDVRTVVIFLVKSYDQDLVSAIKTELTKIPESMQFEIKRLTGAAIRAIVERRWELSHAIPPHPFDAEGDGIQRAFKVPFRLKRALKYISYLLDERLDNHPQGQPWPDAEDLKFKADELVLGINRLGRYWHEV